MEQRIVRALVTGASTGIGEGFARKLAERGVRLVLVARDQVRLEQLAAALTVDVEVLAADLTDPAQLAGVEERLATEDAPVDLLVNNAGLGGYGAIAQLTADVQQRLVDLNVTALVRLTRAALPQLLARDTGGLIQVGSITGYAPNPYAATYGATKAFVRSFTEALQQELSGTRVHALLLAPGTTPTRFQERAGITDLPIPGWAQTDAAQVVDAALRAFAFRRRVCVPGALNVALATGAELSPSTVNARVSGAIHHRFGTGP